MNLKRISYDICVLVVLLLFLGCSKNGNDIAPVVSVCQISNIYYSLSKETIIFSYDSNNKISAIGGTKLTYDSKGRVLIYEPYTLNYDNSDRLISALSTVSANYNFFYNANSQLDKVSCDRCDYNYFILGYNSIDTKNYSSISFYNSNGTVIAKYKITYDTKPYAFPFPRVRETFYQTPIGLVTTNNPILVTDEGGTTIGTYYYTYNSQNFIKTWRYNNGQDLVFTYSNCY